MPLNTGARVAIAAATLAATAAAYYWGGGGATSPVVTTTYFPYDDADARFNGPGHFTCSALNGELNWYVAPSDTFGDSRIWSGPPCPFTRWSQYPDCGSVQQTCGTKVKITCADNCKAGVAPIVAVIADYCPKDHPQNRSNGNCQGGPHFDISKSMWKLMHDRDDNIKVTYEVVPASTPLGPLWTGKGL